MLYNFATMEKSGAIHEEIPLQLDLQVPGDVRLLKIVTLDFAFVDEQYIDDLNESIAAGSQRLDPLQMKQPDLDTDIILYARHRVERLTELHRADHPLARAYSLLRSTKATRPNPQRLLQTVRTIDMLTGDATAALTNNPFLIKLSSDELEAHAEHLARLQRLLHWRGDIQALIHRYPDVLSAGTLKLAVLARLAVSHGTAADRERPAQEVAQLFKNKSVEAHILALLQKPSYAFGDRVATQTLDKIGGVKDHQRFIYEALADPDMAQKMGQKAIRAYLRYRMPNAEMQQAYPYLRTYLSPKNRIEQPSIDASYPEPVEATEPWLLTIGAPISWNAQRKWAEKVNQHAREGSVSLHGKNRSSAYYQKVVAERREFFALLGWDRQKHPLHDKFAEFSDKYPALIPPRNVIELFRIFSKYDVPIIATLGNFMEIIDRSAASIEAKFESLKALGCSPVLFAEEYPSALKLAGPRFEALLARHLAAGKARYVRLRKTI